MQINDSLYYKGQRYSLEPRFSALGGIPEDIRPELQATSTCCWRGYVATWIIDDEGWLRLSEIVTSVIYSLDESPPQNILYDLYKGHDSPVAAYWVNGEYAVGYGEVLGYLGPYLRLYKNYRAFNFVDGKLLDVKEHDSKWRISQFGSPNLLNN